jgi:hypothetical protein
LNERYLGARGLLLSGMHSTPGHRAWRSLTPADKQARLAELRRRQHQQLALDARVLLLVRAR